MSVKEPMTIVEDRLMLCLEIHAKLMNVLDVLEVSRIDKAVVQAQQGLELARTLFDDLKAERQQLKSEAPVVARLSEPSA